MRSAGDHSELALRLRRFIDLADEEIEVLASLESNEETVEARTELLSEGQDGQDCFVLLDGWAASFKDLQDGRRQIITFSVPGDFLGLRSFLLRTADHSVVTLTRTEVSRLPQHRILQIINTRPRLGAAILWSLSREEAIVVEHLVNIGRRSALERTAHLLLELGMRLELVGRAQGTGFEFPVTQEELGDALGLTGVHINRVLRQLRERKLIATPPRRLVIEDLEGLREIAHFSPGYLDQSKQGQPRGPGGS